MTREKQEKSGTMLTKLALKLGERSVNSASVFWMHQPKVPASMLNKAKKD